MAAPAATTDSSPAGQTRRNGLPEVFMSHGRQEDILPISATSRVIVQALEADDSPVTYVEFDGGHTIPPDIAAQAMPWLMR